MPKAWDIVAKRPIYQSEWVNLFHVDLYLPNGALVKDYHVIDYPYAAAGVIPRGDDGKLLLIEQYRFQTKTRGWEIPAGRIDPGESPQESAVRELREETGHAPGEIAPLGHYHPSIGSSNMTFYLFVATGVHRVGQIEDVNETIRMQWFEPDEIRAMIRRNEIVNGLTLTALLWHFLAPSPADE
jgi:8-oxo-dGTP pyrophosphatase MutT (NUDIX family)